MRSPAAVALLTVVVAVIVAGPRALADAPPGHYVVTPDTVRDTRTGLTWQRAITRAAGGANVKSLEDANKLCAAPWRLPHIKELATLVDESVAGPPFIDATAFPETPAIPLWSATLSNTEPDEYRAYVMNPDGTTELVYYNGSLFGGGVVRCVQP